MAKKQTNATSDKAIAVEKITLEQARAAFDNLTHEESEYCNQLLARFEGRSAKPGKTWFPVGQMYFYASEKTLPLLRRYFEWISGYWGKPQEGEETPPKRTGPIAFLRKPDINQAIAILPDKFFKEKFEVTGDNTVFTVKAELTDEGKKLFPYLTKNKDNLILPLGVVTACNGFVSMGAARKKSERTPKSKRVSFDEYYKGEYAKRHLPIAQRKIELLEAKGKLFEELIAELSVAGGGAGGESAEESPLIKHFVEDKLKELVDAGTLSFADKAEEEKFLKQFLEILGRMNIRPDTTIEELRKFEQRIIKHINELGEEIREEIQKVGWTGLFRKKKREGNGPPFPPKLKKQPK